MNSSFYLFICVLKNFVFLSILSVDVRQKRTRCDTLWTTDKDTSLHCLLSFGVGHRKAFYSPREFLCSNKAAGPCLDLALLLFRSVVCSPFHVLLPLQRLNCPPGRCH